MSEETHHARIVHQLRMAGWSREDAINEADRLTATVIPVGPEFARLWNAQLDDRSDHTSAMESAAPGYAERRRKIEEGE